MSEERLEIIKENVYMRSEIAKNSRLGIDTSLSEELELLKEIERLNNIINELEKCLIDKCKYIDENNPLANDKSYITYRTEQKLAYQYILDKLKELKDGDKE